MSDSGRLSQTVEYPPSGGHSANAPMLQPEQRLSVMEEDHVAEAGPRTELLDEGIAAIAVIAPQRAIELGVVVAILRLQKRNAARSEVIPQVFRVAPI